MIRNALIAGATGLVGSQLVTLLINSDYYNSIHVLVRQPYNIKHSKLTAHLVNFEHLGDFDPKVAIHDVYICLGTTMKKAGNKENFLKVDSEYVLNVANWAKQNKSEKLAFISSMGANPKSKTFYLATKGKVEMELTNLGISQIIILRPSLLLGERSEFRFGERIASVFMKLVGPLLTGRLKRIRAVKDILVAFALFYYIRKSDSPVNCYENEDILKLSSYLISH
jgi:uncharacterized protein YbjT (DUF2867 family)